MKNRLIAVFGACLLMSAQALSVSADWDTYDYGYNDYYDYTDTYGYDNGGYTDDNTWDYG